MDETRLNDWELLFERMLMLIDSLEDTVGRLSNWSFGGGTVLMRRYHHRLSKDIDIFFPDPQYLACLSPRLNDTTESFTTSYIEQAGFLKLIFPEGEIDFVASEPLTRHPTVPETLFGRQVMVETSTEIIAKKIWHRGAEFTARDIFDLAMVIENESAALHEILPVFQDRREVVMQRITTNEAVLRETFGELEALDYTRNFDECVEILRRQFGG